MELADYAVQVLGMGKDRKEFMIHLCRPQGPGRCEETGAALYIGKWSVVPGEADLGVGGTSVERSEMTETGQGPEIAKAGPALFAPMDSEVTGGPSCDSGRRAGFGPAREIDGRKEFERAKEPSLGEQKWGLAARVEEMANQVEERRA